MNKYSASIKYGLIAGVVMILIMLAIYFVNKSGFASLFPRVAYVPLLFLMIWGGITARRQFGEFSGFSHAFLTVFIISVTATMLFDTFNYVLYKTIDPTLPALIKGKLIAKTNDDAERLGLSDEKRDETLGELKNADYTPNLISLMEQYASSVIIGAILSLLIGLFVNRPDMRPQVKAGE